jgi:hypothetical protein
MGFSEYGVFGIWGFRNMGFSEYGVLGIWGSRNMGFSEYKVHGYTGFTDIQGFSEYGVYAGLILRCNINYKFLVLSKNHIVI